MGLSIFGVLNAQGQPVKELGKGNESDMPEAGFSMALNDCMGSDGATAAESGMGVDGRTDGPNGSSPAHRRFHDNMDMRKKPCDETDSPKGVEPDAPAQPTEPTKDDEPLEGAISVKNEDEASSPTVFASDGERIATLDAEAADKAGMDNAYSHMQAAPLLNPAPLAGLSNFIEGRRAARTGAAISDNTGGEVGSTVNGDVAVDEAKGDPQAAPLPNQMPVAGLSNFAEGRRTVRTGAAISDNTGAEVGSAVNGDDAVDEAKGDPQAAPLSNQMPVAGLSNFVEGRRTVRTGAAISDNTGTEVGSTVNGDVAVDKAKGGSQAAPLSNPMPVAGLSGFVQDMRTAQDSARPSDASGLDGAEADNNMGGIGGFHKKSIRGASTAFDAVKEVKEPASDRTEPARAPTASKGPADTDLSMGAANGGEASKDASGAVAATGVIIAAAAASAEVVREPVGKGDGDGRDIEAGDNGEKDTQAIKGGIHRPVRDNGVVAGAAPYGLRQAHVAGARPLDNKAAGAPAASVAQNGSAGRDGAGTADGKGLEGKGDEGAKPADNAFTSIAAVFSPDGGVDRAAPNVAKDIQQPPHNPAAESGVFDRIDSGIKIAVTKGAKEVSISLHPEHLGAIHIKLNIEDHSENTVSAKITVDNMEVKGLLDSDARALKDAFSRQGLKLDNYTIEVGRNAFGSDNQNGRYPGGAGAWAGNGAGGGYRDGAPYRGALGRFAGTEEMKDGSYNGSTPVRARQGVGGSNAVDLFA